MSQPTIPQSMQTESLQPLPSGGPIAGAPSAPGAAASRSAPPAAPSASGQPYAEMDLETLLSRVRKQISTTGGESRPNNPGSSGNPAARDFLPLEPETLIEAQLSESFVQGLLLKYLLAVGTSTGRDAVEQTKLPFKLLDELLRQMKIDKWVIYRGSAAMNDYVYELTDMGRERGRRLSEQCTYYGAAPVSLKDYIASVHAQSLTKQHPTAQDLERAFEDLLINPRMFKRLGPAISSGRGLFLYGPPGNGKSTIAERITRAFGNDIWIPRAIGIDGEVIRVFDPNSHEAIPQDKNDGLLDQGQIDRRWIRIRRPTIIVGGELTMANLEVTVNTSTRISEAPLQLKSNCGTLVIDDFGRQRMSTDELLNRWIVPLEKRFDFLNLPNGKKIEVPFDQLIVFSTNLEPRELVDDAFLRRIPYKIDVLDPSEEEFRELFKMMCPKMGFEYCEDEIDYLIARHYQPVRRPFRACQPRDLLLQIRNYCLFFQQPLRLSAENFDFAVENYFAVI